MSTSSKHVVLGGNGVVGRETVRALIQRGETPASVGRKPPAINGARSVIADLLEPAAAERALDGADVAYFTVGLPYRARAWEREWPTILRNSIDAAIAHGTHLVYLDNVYAYGRVNAPMTESTPIRPNGRKGRVRGAALAALHDAASSRGLIYTVGRSADFYGPGASTSVFNTFALSKIAAGKRPTWLFDATQPHSLTFTPDIGGALAILGTDPRARSHTWHLPTAPAQTGAQYLNIASGGAGECHTMTATTMRIGALFSTAARETLEMAYQYTAPYHFDSSAFRTTFGIDATPYESGIATTLAAMRDTH